MAERSSRLWVRLIDHADAEEQGAGGNAVVDHLQHRPFNPLVHDKNAQGDKTHMADSGIGNQFLHVLLGQGGEPAIDDTGHRQPQYIGHEQGGGFRGYGQAKRRKP